MLVTLKPVKEGCQEGFRLARFSLKNVRFHLFSVSNYINQLVFKAQKKNHLLIYIKKKNIILPVTVTIVRSYFTQRCLPFPKVSFETRVVPCVVGSAFLSFSLKNTFLNLCQRMRSNTQH